MPRKKLPVKRRLKQINITLEREQIKYVSDNYDNSNLSKAIRILINKDMVLKEAESK